APGLGSASQSIQTPNGAQTPEPQRRGAPMPLRPDPTFYPSPANAMAAPAEELAYVVTLNTGTNGDARPDALAVVDVNPESSTYGTKVGRLDMPNVGDELPHFGWNPCSRALRPRAPRPHVARRHVIVPGLRA